MRKVFLLAAAAVLMSGTALADTVTGAGGPIPASTVGPNPTWGSGGSPPVLPANPFTSTVFVPIGVASVNSITFHGLTHVWIGDLHAVLVDPTGTEHNIFVRPGLWNTSSFGNSGDFLLGDYTFIESGAPNNLPTTSSPVVNPPPGTYNQTFAGSPTVGGTWVNGQHNIFNTPMSQINHAVAGDWTLKIYDWFPTGDHGALVGWTLDYAPIPAPGALALLGIAGLAGVSRRRR